MSDDGILFDHLRNQSYSDEMVGYTQQITEVVTTLEQELAPIAQHWLGGDRDIYFQRVQPTWDAEVHGLSQILQSHASTLDDISDNYRRTVAINAEGFESIAF
jgi:WXG100 family type VII secretion target